MRTRRFVPIVCLTLLTACGGGGEPVITHTRVLPSALPTLLPSFSPKPVDLPAVAVTGGGQVTWYQPSGNLTACGGRFADSDYIAAVSIRLWTAPNTLLDPLCGESLQVTSSVNHLTVRVRIEDLCPSCDPDRIELSQGAFALLTDLGDGIAGATWHTVPAPR